jgi:hypothetical protein
LLLLPFDGLNMIISLLEFSFCYVKENGTLTRGDSFRVI